MSKHDKHSSGIVNYDLLKPINVKTDKQKKKNLQDV